LAEHCVGAVQTGIESNALSKIVLVDTALDKLMMTVELAFSCSLSLVALVGLDQGGCVFLPE